MIFWDNIINTAMLGTDKRQLAANELTPDLETVSTKILADESIDDIEKFMRIAATTMNYRKCGATPLHTENILATSALPEEKKYCSEAAFLTVKEILDIESTPLLLFWLQHCQANNLIVFPEIIPVIFDAAVKQKTLQAVAAECCGRRGEWLANFNKEWSFSTNATDEEFWQTGLPEQRKEVFSKLRKSDITLARQWLQQSWAQEDAETKTSFLQLMTNTIDDGDISFLESLSNEKSKKVKDAALDLLKQIPNAGIVKLYWEAAKQMLSVTIEKGLFGLSKKKKLVFHIPEEIDASIFKTSVEKLSNNKNFTDDEFIFYQLLQHVPLNNWEDFFVLSAEEILSLFKQDEIFKKMVPALADAAVRFNNAKWAEILIRLSDVFYADLIPLLSTEQQILYSNQFFTGNETQIIYLATQQKTEWDVQLSQKIMTYTAKLPYQYPKSFYSENIRFIPVSIVTQLMRFNPQEPHLQSHWNNMSDFIAKLLRLKEKTMVSMSSQL